MGLLYNRKNLNSINTNKTSQSNNFSLKNILKFGKKEQKQPTIEIVRENPTITVEKTKSVDFKLDMSGFEDISTKVTIPSDVKQTGIICDITPFEVICNNPDKTWVNEQGKVAAIWKQNKKSSRSIAMIDGRYLIAVNGRFGNVGDNVDVVLDDGTIINCTIMDIKADTNERSAPYGHYFTSPQGNKTQSIIEWEVLSNIKEPADLSPYIEDWHLKNVVEIVNTGINIIK